jgi:hypothetical protein
MTARERLRHYQETNKYLDPRACVLVPEDMEPCQAILQNVWETGYTGGCVLFFESL